MFLSRISIYKKQGLKRIFDTIKIRKYKGFEIPREYYRREWEFGGQLPLGLMREPDDNGHLIIDSETASTIRQIYDLALDGMGNMRTCKALMEERIPVTRVHQSTDLDVDYYAAYQPFWEIHFIRAHTLSARHTKRDTFQNLQYHSEGTEVSYRGLP